jgi:serine/threonine protein kinase
MIYEKKKRLYAILEKLSIPDLDKLRFSNKYSDIDRYNNYNFKQLIKESLDGLKCMNKNGFVHLDIKLQNIGIGFDKKAKLFDFGSSRYIDKDGQEIDFFKFTQFYFDPNFRNNSDPNSTTTTSATDSNTTNTSTSATKTKIFLNSDIYSFGNTLLLIYFGKNNEYIGKTKTNNDGYYQPTVDKWITETELNRIYFDKGDDNNDNDTNKLKDLIQKMMNPDPNKRIIISDVLLHPWFTEKIEPPSPKKHSIISRVTSRIGSIFKHNRGGKRKYKSKKNKSSRRKKNKTVKTI